MVSGWLLTMAASHGTGQRPVHKPIMIIVFATLVYGLKVSAQQGNTNQAILAELPSSLPYSGSKNRVSSSDVMLRDRKKSLADNEVFDGTTKGQLDLLLSELREVRTEIREARQEHGRLASGVAEISDQVKIISDRKDQIKKKIRKLTKTLSKKDHHRKVKSGLKALQQDHERILQAMSKAKLLNRTLNRRNNRTNNHHNHTSTHHNHTRNHKCKENNSTSHVVQLMNETQLNATIIEKGSNYAKPNHIQEEGNGEQLEENNIPAVLPIEIEKKASINREVNQLKTALYVNHDLATNPPSSTVPTTLPPTTATTTTTTPMTSTTTTTPKPTTMSPSPSPSSQPLPANCYEVLQEGNWTSGVYTIQAGTLDPIKVRRLQITGRQSVLPMKWTLPLCRGINDNAA